MRMYVRIYLTFTNEFSEGHLIAGETHEVEQNFAIVYGPGPREFR